MKTAVFDIRSYLDRLNIIKETPTEYHCSCPVCSDGGFKIEKKTGKYNAFKCHCDLKAIREAIRPWQEVKEELDPRNKRDKPKTKKGTQKLAFLARLAEIPTTIPKCNHSNIPDWLVKQGVPATASEIKYWYSSNQWVSRFQWKDSTKPKGKDKTFRQGHILTTGKVKWTKGKQRWKAYRLEEAIAFAKNRWVIGAEGEGCVEASRGIGLADTVGASNQFKLQA